MSKAPLICFDMEGPLTPSDFAFSVFSSVIPDGDVLFALLSEYDDILSLELCRAGYEPGDTLALVLPFLIARGMTADQMATVARQFARLTPGANEVVSSCRNLFQSVAVITTSYAPFATRVAAELAIPASDLFCTELPGDWNSLCPAAHSNAIRAREESIVRTLGGLDRSSPKRQDDLVATFDNFYHRQLGELGVSYPGDVVSPRGGSRKADAIQLLCSQAHVALSDVIFVGDSITDVAAFELLDENGGLGVSFNGNSFAVDAATVAVGSESLLGIMPVLAAFTDGRRGAVLDLCTSGVLDHEAAVSDTAWLAEADQPERSKVAERHSVPRSKLREKAAALG